MSFFGRSKELEKLEQLRKKPTASLVCILGRRRVGKSALIAHFGKKFNQYIEIQGLGPSEKDDLGAQLEHFTNQLNIQLGANELPFANWDLALNKLAQLTAKGECLILLDEISWMGKGDDFFAEKIKTAWDVQFKKNPRLILVLCGSVSTWIQKNILESASFVGRVSLQINLKEMLLSEISSFWDKQHFKMGSFEKLMILGITGGVPKYLEEILKQETATKNLAKLCFDPDGLLFNDYTKIFNEIFARSAGHLETIIRRCLVEKLGPSELAHKLGIDQDRHFSESIKILELSGFLSRDYYFKPENSEVSKFSQLRVKDNYLRFYLKVIEPLKLKIEKGNYVIDDLLNLPSYQSILGYQLENLVLNNVARVIELLDLQPHHIQSAAPYAQKKTSRTKGACQVDLLVHSNLDVFYPCEIKCVRVLTKKVLREVKKKLDVINIPKRSSLKPVLIYEGEIYPDDLADFETLFYRMFPFSRLMGY